jgi:hypothetical protein
MSHLAKTLSLAAHSALAWISQTRGFLTGNLGVRLRISAVVGDRTSLLLALIDCSCDASPMTKSFPACVSVGSCAWVRRSRLSLVRTARRAV